jgi:hypothetical protein
VSVRAANIGGAPLRHHDESVSPAEGQTSVDACSTVEYGWTVVNIGNNPLYVCEAGMNISAEFDRDKLRIGRKKFDVVTTLFHHPQICQIADWFAACELRLNFSHIRECAGVDLPPGILIRTADDMGGDETVGFVGAVRAKDGLHLCFTRSYPLSKQSRTLCKRLVRRLSAVPKVEASWSAHPERNVVELLVLVKLPLSTTLSTAYERFAPLLQ